MTDTRGRMLLVNKTFCENVGVCEAEFLAAAHYNEILPEEESRACMASEAAAWAQDTPYHAEEILRFADGQPHTLEVIKTKIKDSSGTPIDIHNGLDDTLVILQHRLRQQGKRPEIVVIKQYAQLPLVTCYASQLNQVFMNILTNAIDALEETDNHKETADVPLTITIGTQALDSDWVSIRIADNGCGMSEQVLSRIFDPFFTTKPVGSGTGLGLSISYSIVVDKHQGQLQCYSVPGQGTEFIIAIPIQQGLLSNSALPKSQLETS